MIINKQIEKLNFLYQLNSKIMLEMIINLHNLIIKNIIYKNNRPLYRAYIYIFIYTYIKKVIEKRLYYLRYILSII